MSDPFKGLFRGCNLLNIRRRYPWLFIGGGGVTPPLDLLFAFGSAAVPPLADIPTLRASTVPNGGFGRQMFRQTGSPQNLYVWEPLSVLADDGDLVIKHTATATGRFLRIRNNLSSIGEFDTIETFKAASTAGHTIGIWGTITEIVDDTDEAAYFWVPSGLGGEVRPNWLVPDDSPAIGRWCLTDYENGPPW